jgi:TPP-dependent trihydroxycyclohexane-1,2-dione (THcHDO) dehydratase
MRLTVAQAVVRCLGTQYSESDGVEQKLFAGCLGIFGHGNVAGIDRDGHRGAGSPEGGRVGRQVDRIGAQDSESW